MDPYWLQMGRASFLSTPRDRFIYRFLEMVPGGLVWTTLAGVFVLSFFKPVWVALFIIAFDIFWLFNAIYLAGFIISSYVRMRRALKIDWLKKLEESGIGNRELGIMSWREVCHLIILPMYNESVEVVGGAVQALVENHYPHEKFLVVVAIEERAGERAQETARAVKERFGKEFGAFLITTHPKDIPGEIAGKGSNETWACREAVAKLVDPAGIAHERVIVSSFDSDTRAYPHYFACLTYHFLTAANPTRSSYQPLPLYHNNIWEAPFFSRVSATGSTIWQLFMQSQPDVLETFSSHSMSLKALVSAGYWNTRVVSEDSIIFAQCFLAFDGDYRVVPLYYPVSMDANVSRSFVRTAISIYRQNRRWAYGVEKLPYALFGFVKNHKIPVWRKFRMSARLFFGFWTWGCASLLIGFFGWMPLVFGGDEFKSSVLAFNLPRFASRLLTLAMVGLLVNGALTFILLPKRPTHVSRWVYGSLIFQWMFLPVTMVLFSAIPAIEAQTRMMLGKYLGFFVTEKVRKRVRSEE